MSDDKVFKNCSMFEQHGIDKEERIHRDRRKTQDLQNSDQSDYNIYNQCQSHSYQYVAG